MAETPGDGDAGEATALLAELLGLPAAVGKRPELTPQQRRARTFQALLAYFEGLAARQPLLMILEDAHWLDPPRSSCSGWWSTASSACRCSWWRPAGSE